MNRSLFIILVLLVFPVAHISAQDGPFVPCVGCNDLTQVPYPEPGAWFNPDQSGSGFTFEFQNGVMAGFYFGYDTKGEPVWYLVSTRLQRSEKPGVMWELEVEPSRYSGGSCLGCLYQAPNEPEKQPMIRIEFLQRAYARITLSDGSFQYMVPIMYGTAGLAYFAEQTPYLFPKLTPNPFVSMWNLVFKGFSEEEHAPWTWSSGVFMIGQGSLATGGAHPGMLFYGIDEPAFPPEVAVGVGNILCGLDEELGEPGCTLRLNGVNPIEFRIPIGNFTDSRIFGETEDGITVQGFRLNYD